MCAIITAVATVVAFLILPRDLKGGRGNYHDQLILFKDRRIWQGIIFVISGAGVLYGFYTYIRPLIHQQLQFDVNTMSLLLLVIGLIDLAANQVAGRIAASKGFQILLPIYLLDMLLLCSFNFMMLNQKTGLILIFLLNFFVCLFGSTAQVFFLNEASQKYPAAINLASTFNALFYNVGIALSSMTAGQTLRIGGLPALGWNSLGYCLIAVIMLLVLNKEHKA